ncbi:MAG: gliding motility-associated C-terminal domain-containing protein, partial [Bacteroidota bacterium]|nr:gliding motility-associated C-terminal domain-containing protein [Bacteroidota bacterium]
PGDTAVLYVPAGFTDPLWNSISTELIFQMYEEGFVVLQATDINGCISSDSVQVSLIDFTETLADTSFLICFGESVDLIVTASGSVSWYSDQALNDLVGTGDTLSLVQPELDMLFYVTQAEGICTSPAAEVDLVVVPTPAPIDLIAPDPLCEGLPFTITVIGDTAYTFSWSTPLGAFTGQQLQIDPATTINAGMYTVTPIDQGCAGASVDATVIVLIPIPIDLGVDTSFCEGSEFQLMLPGGNTDPLWSTGNTATSITITTTGTFSVNAIDTQGCSTFGDIDLEVIPCDLEVPNVFTPNGDGINDHWMLGPGPYNAASLMVYNRWGDLVWQGNITRTGFDGKHYKNGEPLSEGTYFYVLSIERTDREHHDQEGYLDLLR